MILKDKEQIDTLERALAGAYRAGSDRMVHTVDVTQRVMRNIRRPTGDRGWWTASVLPDELVWRTATVAAAAVLIITVLTVGIAQTGAGENWLLAEEFEATPLFAE
ncbi:MAG TPA: hypothetical protein VJ746_17565 [Nitrospira sp.]|nr:hypothetical protein [Nitrospira sp.]